MGVVYKAEDTRLKRIVALKFLPPELTRDEEARERFIQEAQAASALDHPNICTIYDVDSTEPGDAGQQFIAMAYYDGETLKSRLVRGPLPVAEAVDIAVQIARGLDKAHQAGIIHRDIKPANVMITTDGLVKIVDFGIAKLLDHTGPTRTGTTLGTVAYMAPEQIQGRATDRRVDLWAIGVVLYEMLTGRPPFGGEREMAILRNILDETPPAPSSLRPDVPASLDAVVMRALAKDPAARFLTAQDLIRDLTPPLPAMTGTVTLPMTAAPARQGSRVLLAVTVGAALLAVAGTAGWFLSRASDARRVEQLAAEVTRLADSDDYGRALIALEALEQLAPADARIADLAARISDTRDIVTNPEGASVSIKPYDDQSQPWQLLGRTPLTGVRLPRERFRWKIELDGYDSVEVFGVSTRGFPPLAKAGTNPPNTILVGRGPAVLQLTGYNYETQVPSGAFVIDKFEVTNRQYKAFVDAGGYARREFWTREFVRDGRALTWEEVLATFRDRTGRPGPATWDVGTYPAGHDEFPVTGVSWYEADAFAAFSGRSLPTVYHWIRVAGVGQAAYMTPLSNMDGKGPAPVGTMRV
jgi:hypothetical protein